MDLDNFQNKWSIYRNRWISGSNNEKREDDDPINRILNSV